LRELCYWLLLGIIWFKLMHGVSCWVVLCDNGFDCSDGHLCCWKILNRFINLVFKLPRWNLPGLNRIFFMYSLHWRVVLCHDRFDCSDGRLCCRLILNIFIDSLYKLFSWDIYVYCIFN